ncbi:gluconate 5-dehydrogenase [Penicillium angulare]|uniref:3-oxoacyl-[acyl-carrier-protein] reductase n=1 Tax=Penicillium angulare TaxID=116970 RepID=A0A9W9FXM7_9EURO|nr:gluconate 5-dehydrogenase [Penicillium angulare]
MSNPFPVEKASSLSLLNKVALVTGGSRGLGAGIARELAKRGANILITYNSAKGEAEKVAQAIEEYGRQCIFMQGRSSDRDAPKRIIESGVQKWGKIDIIVNNAGAGDDCFLADLTHELWDNIYDANIRMPTFLVQAAMPYLGPAPRIVNISSVAARNGSAQMSAYASSKAALEGITRVWASELGQTHNATVNCVNPGPIATDMWLRDTDPEVLKFWDEKMKETPAAPRIATVDDVAQIVAFLAEEGSRWCTGSVVNANGGLVPV